MSCNDFLIREGLKQKGIDGLGLSDFIFFLIGERDWGGQERDIYVYLFIFSFGLCV